MKKFAVVLFLFPLFAGAQLDPASRDLLIEKLNGVNLGLAPDDSSKVGVTLRLADLLAERARLASMSELEKGCTVCDAGAADRKKALGLYRDVLDRVPQANRGKVLIQVGHLSQLNGDSNEAQAFYGKVLHEVQDPAVRAEANLSLAEMAFKAGQFAKARGAYDEVLGIATASSKGLAAYRSAWCSFNLGETDHGTQGLIKILETPDYLTKTGVATHQIDPEFQAEVSRDLATFLSKKSVTLGDVDKLFALSPEATRLANVTLLAAEAERIGRKKEALMVWNFVYAKEAQPAQRLDVLAHRAPLWLETGERDKALADLEAATSLWKELGGCGKADCAEPKKLLRQFVVTWNQAEKKTPTAELSKGYGLYLSAFPTDVEMQLWGAQVATELKDWTTAMSRQDAAIAALKAVKESDRLENALLGAIEMAEASGSDEALARVQAAYLAGSPKQTKKFEVQYQKARRLYEKNQYAEAAGEMKALALDAKGPKAVRQQAADLALDALGLLKDDEKIVAWSKEFATALPDQAANFSEVRQKAILTRSASLAATDPQAAWTALEAFDLRQASAGDRVTALKNKLILAEKTGNFMAAMNAADDLLTIRDLKPDDREFALGRKAWLAELRLDFASAFKATEQMAAKDSTPDQRALKLAIYADLSGQNPLPLYQQYLKATKDEEGRQAVASEIVRRAKDPAKEIESQRPILEKSPDLLARLYTEAYAKTPSDQILKKASVDGKIAKTDWGRLLQRVALLKEFTPVKTRLAAQKLESSSQKTLARGIKSRAADLGKLEALAAKAIQAGDWTSQLVTIDAVAKESDRFYQELLSLPMPEGLKPEEEQEYMQLLGQQSSPFKMKAEQAQAKVKEFWANPHWKEDLAKSVKDGAEFRALIGEELAALKAAAPEEHRAIFAQLEDANHGEMSLPDVKDLELARRDVREKPLDRASVEKLLELEKKTRHFAMVQYLEGRLRGLEAKEVKP